MFDIVGPLPPSQGHRFLLTYPCTTSRFFQANLLQEASSQEAARPSSIAGWPYSGSPARWPQTTALPLWRMSGRIIWWLMTKLYIKVKYLALYRPLAIGMLERQHRPLKDPTFGPPGQRTAFQRYQCIIIRAHFRDKFKKSLSTSFGPFGGGIYPQ